MSAWPLVTVGRWLEGCPIYHCGWTQECFCELLLWTLLWLQGLSGKMTSLANCSSNWITSSLQCLIVRLCLIAYGPVQCLIVRLCLIAYGPVCSDSNQNISFFLIPKRCDDPLVQWNALIPPWSGNVAMRAHYQSSEESIVTICIQNTSECTDRVSW